MPKTQALPKRKPDLTQEEFSDLWSNHAAIVAPMFLYAGVQYYAQVTPLSPPSIHMTSRIPDPRSPDRHIENSRLDIISWDGAAERLSLDSWAPDPQWLIDYYKEVVIVDEKRYLDREVAEWFKRVELGTVDGDRKVIIKGGKSLIKVPEEAISILEGV